MVKEYLHCVSRNKNIDGRDGIVYTCVKDTQSSGPSNKLECHVCKKVFKDERCLKIHKTKMQHWIQYNARKRNIDVSSPRQKIKKGKNRTH